jgi:CheY-like chemotaxis protein
VNPKSIKRDELQDVLREAQVPNIDVSTHDLDFKDLMRNRVNNILLVSSRYDFYTIVEDGQLTEAIVSEFQDLNMHYAPLITRVYSGEAALDAMREQQFDLVITMQRLGDMDLKSFCTTVKKAHPGIQLALLAYQSRELQFLLERKNTELFDRVFIWSGDRKLFLAVIKLLEDWRNAMIDCLEFGIRAILLVEDSPQFYSSYLPLIYTELIQQSQMLIEEGRNFADKLLRQRARPKILHATDYETALKLFFKFRRVLLGVITDLKFPINGVESENAGLAFIQRVKKEKPDLPILVQSAQAELAPVVAQYGAEYVDKNSRTLLLEVREFMKRNFGFGEFIFRMPDGEEVGRAKNIRELQSMLRVIPDESLLFHASRDHFSNWLIARTRFQLANELKPLKIKDFSSISAVREHMIYQIEKLVIRDQRGIIADFKPEEQDSFATFLRIGGGSLGGKARGLAFIDTIFKNYLRPEYFPDIKVSIPKTIVLCTDVFSEFMELNGLFPFVVQNISDEEIIECFLSASFPEHVLDDLRSVLEQYQFPLAVRSSSLLEDTLYQPFAGIYATLMIPNCNRDFEIRFQELQDAIKYVFASTYFRSAKNYIEATGHRIEEEKMAVVLQQMVGKKYDHYFYPHYSGVARSFNYYPFGNARQVDGVVNVALGLGRTIVEGGVSLQFCPIYPTILPQFTNRKDYFSNSQRKFYALDLDPDLIRTHPIEEENLMLLDIKDAEAHGTLQRLASTYSSENDTLYEGTFIKGHRVLNFAPVLESESIPLARLLKLLLKLCETAMNCPVEIEFAGTLPENAKELAEFEFLQVRPMVKEEGTTDIDIAALRPEDALLKSENVLGNGVYKLSDIVFVKPDGFDVTKTRNMATEMAALNAGLNADRTPYLLIGPGRWGSADPWLGIPVKFTDISGAHVIVETSLPNMLPDPSQGSHFFQNLTSFRIAYFTTRHYKTEHAIDWDWLNGLEVVTETTFLKHVRAPQPLEIVVDGQTSCGVILKELRMKN